jgi:hypothetical protein
MCSRSHLLFASLFGPKEDELLFDWDLFEAEESIAEDSEGSTCETKTWDVDQWLG